MDRETRRIFRYRPTPAVTVLLVIVLWIALSLAVAGHWQLTAVFVVVAVPWYLVWRHHRVVEARRFGLLPDPGRGPDGSADGSEGDSGSRGDGDGRGEGDG